MIVTIRSYTYLNIAALCGSSILISFVFETWLNYFCYKYKSMQISIKMCVTLYLPPVIVSILPRKSMYYLNAESLCFYLLIDWLMKTRKPLFCIEKFYQKILKTAELNLRFSNYQLIAVIMWDGVTPSNFR